jgi:hypothetical protein
VSGARGCVADPSGCGYPDASNTGASGSLTASGSITSTTDGQVIKNLFVTGYIKVTSANVVIENVKVVGGDMFGAIDTQGATGHTTVSDVTLIASVSQLAGMTVRDTTIERANISGGQDGIDLWGGLGDHNVVEDSYIHDLSRSAADDSHDDTLQTSGGTETFIHNTLLPFNGSDPMNSCLQIGALQGNLGSLTFSSNLCDGGNYSLNANSSGIGAVLKGSVLTAGPLTYTNNRFGSDYRFGVQIHLGSPFHTTWTGNIDDTTGNGV